MLRYGNEDVCGATAPIAGFVAIKYSLMVQTQCKTGGMHFRNCYALSFVWHRLVHRGCCMSCKITDPKQVTSWGGCRSSHSVWRILQILANQNKGEQPTLPSGGVTLCVVWSFVFLMLVSL